MQRYTELGSRIRAARNAKGWSQQRLAEILGCERQRIILWEKGSHRPNLYYRDKLTELFGEFDWSPDPPPVAQMDERESGADMRTEKRFEERAA